MQIKCCSILRQINASPNKQPPLEYHHVTVEILVPMCNFNTNLYENSDSSTRRERNSLENRTDDRGRGVLASQRGKSVFPRVFNDAEVNVKEMDGDERAEKAK